MRITSMARRHQLIKPGSVVWLIPSGGAAYLWARAHEIGHLGGLGAAEGFSLALWPLLVTAAVFGPAGVFWACVPRGWRKRWNRSHGRPCITAMLRRAILHADRHRCLYCGARAALQFDHVFPYSLGGRASLWNLAVLCARCNRVKSNYWRFRSGHVVYRAWEGSADARTAAAILAAERLARWNVARWVRAAWGLGVL